MEMEEHKKEWIKLNGAWCQIDEECVDWVLLFNKVGLTTKFCCHGEDAADNNYMIMFHEDVMDEQINEFLLKYPKCGGSSSGQEVVGHLVKYYIITGCSDRLLKSTLKTSSKIYMIIMKI